MTDETETNGTPADDAELRRAGAFLRSAMPAPAFAEGFSDRTMARLNAARQAAPSPATLRTQALTRRFPLFAAAAALLIVSLGLYNTTGTTLSADATFVEAALGLEPVTAESVIATTSDLTP